MQGGGDPVGGGVRATDDGRGKFLPEAVEGMGAVQGVRGGDDEWIDGRAHKETTQEVGGGDMELGNLGHGGRTVDVQHCLPGQGRPAEFPDSGIPRTSGDEDGDVGPFSAPEYQGHHGHLGGGKTPPPTVPPTQMLVTWRALNGRHLANEQCARETGRKRRPLS